MENIVYNYDNGIIAEFMGAILHKNWTSEIYKIPQDTYEFKINPTKFSSKFWLVDEMSYHSSWEWLMPVVEKIESINDPYHGHFGVHICSNSCTIQSTKFRSDKPIANPPYYFADYTLNSKIESVWLAVINFIEWYNKQNKNN